MSKPKTTYLKMQRERDKQAKAKAKRERRLADSATSDDATAEPATRSLPSEVVLELIAEAQRQYDNEEITFEEYDERKADLLSRLAID